MPGDSLLDAALDYARRGWSILPIRRGTKHPAVRSWKRYQTERATEDELRRWFTWPDVGGLAVSLGAVSGGLIARDFDQLDAYEGWAAAHPDLAATLPTVETARGRHVYICSTWSGFAKLADGELIGTPGHYCLLPPSIHPTGAHYRWAVPWPDGGVPSVDPYDAGFLSETERTEETESQSNQGGHAHCSVPSVSQLVDSPVDDALEAAIRGTQPSEVGQRNRAIFKFARALKAIPALADAPVATLRDIVRRWHERALPVIGTKPFDETWAEFVAAWPCVRFPLGQEPMTLIVQRADESPPPQVPEGCDAPQTRRLIAICRELQRASGDDPFFLSCRTAGRLLGMDHVTAWRRLGMLEADGVLLVAKKGTTGTKGRATRYRYTGD